MNFTELVAAAAVSLFAGMLLCFEVGRRIGIARMARDPQGGAVGSGPVEAAVFGLLGLLIAFTFSGAGNRFEERRQLIAVEANAIGTAYLRLDLLPADAQPSLRDLFRRYLDVRVRTYGNAADAQGVQALLDEGAALQRQIWTGAVAASGRTGMPSQASMLLLPALNEMFDMTTTRAVAMRSHPPLVIHILLAVLSLVSALLGGYVMCATRVRSWFYMLMLAGTLSLSLYVILDLEYPRLGQIRIDAADDTLRQVGAQMR